MRSYDDISEVMFFLLVLLILMSGCAKRIYIPVKSEKIIKETVIDTVVDVQLVQSEKVVQIQPPDTISMLENQYSYSKWERIGGIDYHYLWTKNSAKTHVKWRYKEVITRDTVYIDQKQAAKARDDHWSIAAIAILSIALIIAVVAIKR